MTSDKILTQDYAQDVVNQIRQFFPKMRDVRVDVDLNPRGEYETKIQVKARNKFVVAHKSDTVLVRGLQKTLDAVIRQLQRLSPKKRNHLHFRPT